MTKYLPRSGFVLIRVKFIDTNEQGVAVPQTSAEAKQYHVEAVGPGVKDVEVGDRVLMIGRPNEDYWQLPNSKDLILIKESCVAVVVKDGE